MLRPSLFGLFEVSQDVLVQRGLDEQSIASGAAAPSLGRAENDRCLPVQLSVLSAIADMHLVLSLQQLLLAILNLIAVASAASLRLPCK